MQPGELTGHIAKPHATSYFSFNDDSKFSFSNVQQRSDLRRAYRRWRLCPVGRIRPMNLLISMTQDAIETTCHDVRAEGIIRAVRSGKWRSQIERIRAEYARVLDSGSNDKDAKKAVDPLKKRLPGVLWSGKFSYRNGDSLLTHSGLLCADLDDLGKRLPLLREKFASDPHVWACFISPTGAGLKVIFRVPPDSELHNRSYCAVERYCREVHGVEIDTSCKDTARLCFVSFDPDAYLNRAAAELPLLPAEQQKAAPPVIVPSPANVSARQHVAEEIFGAIDWTSSTEGFARCPGVHLHTAANGERDFKLMLDGAPTATCFHSSCRGIVDGANHVLRSRIGKLESAKPLSDPSREPQQRPDRNSAATELIKLADQFEFFRDPQGRGFVRLPVNGCFQVWPLTSSQFRKLLAQQFYMRNRAAVNRNALADAIDTLEGRALFDSSEQPVFLRVATYGESILIDLCDPLWRVIEVTGKGWTRLDHSPVAFVRTPSMRPLPTPSPAGKGSLEPLWGLFNVTAAQRPLVAGALLNGFHPNGPYFVVNYVGEQGTAKSCATKIHRQLVDPNEAPLRSPPREERDLLVQAAKNRCVVLDNLSKLPPWLSDSLCRLATGGGHSARQLFTDGEEFSLAVKRPVILNGIEDVAVRPDLAERALQIELETIPDDSRMPEEELWERFEEVRPVIFSGLLNGLVRALRDADEVRLGRLPRMADAVLFATAAETAFEWERGTFLSAYEKNLSDGAIASIEASAVGVAIQRFLEGGKKWSGEPSQLLKALNEIVGEDTRRSEDWPKNPRGLSGHLRRLSQALRRSGIDFAIPTRGKRRSIQLCKAGNPASAPSAPSPTTPLPRQNDGPDAKIHPLHEKQPEVVPPAKALANTKPRELIEELA